MSQKVLTCSPKYFTVAYEINPWMSTANQVDLGDSIKEWTSLTVTFRDLGLEIEQVEPEPDLPDLVFTANAGLVYRNNFFPSNFRFKERQPERKVFVDWFKSQGHRIVNLPKELIFEGAGDALFCGNKLFLGFGFRSVKSVADFLAPRIPDFEIVSLGLSNPYFYHLDTCFSPLPSGHFIYYPDAFDDESRLKLQNLGGYEITEELCINYGCNLVFIDQTLVTGFSDSRLMNIAREEGLKLKVVEMTEFMKSGGGVRCTTLFI